MFQKPQQRLVQLVNSDVMLEKQSLEKENEA
jgi:hypothetical protein